MGYGGGVDIEQRELWHVIGRYGWVGGTGTCAYVVPSDGSISILLTQTEVAVPAVLSSWRPSGRLPLRTTATTTDEPQGIPHRLVGGARRAPIARTALGLPVTSEVRTRGRRAADLYRREIGSYALVLSR